MKTCVLSDGREVEFLGWWDDKSNSDYVERYAVIRFDNGDISNTLKANLKSVPTEEEITICRWWEQPYVCGTGLIVVIVAFALLFLRK